MPNALVRCLAALSAAPLALVLAPSHASGQEPTLEVFYRKLEPKEQFKYLWKGKPGSGNAGVLRWEVPETQFGTNGLDRNFSGYCAEVLAPIVAEKLYRFRASSPYDAKSYGGLDGREGAVLAAQRRAIYVKELFGRYFRDPVLKPVSAEEAVALQVALWEVAQETEPAEGTPKLDLFGGDFQADYPRDQAPAYVLRAQGYLDSLTGDDAAFYSNPDLRGRELVRLQGIPNAEGVVGQSQYALRFAGGGGAGASSLASALTTGAGLGAFGGVGGFGGPVAGLGTGTGAGAGGAGFIGTGTPGSGFTNTPVNGTPTTTTTTPPGQLPVVTPPGGGPPEQPPEVTPHSPVPAPPAVLLSAIAFGTIGSWRLGVRLLRAK